MEKPRMDRRRSLLRSRLLGGLLLFWGLTLPVKAQTDISGDSDYLKVEIQTDPESPDLYEPWSLTLLVDHPSPQEVEIQYPPLPPALSLESVRTGARILEHTRWTAIEFWFIPQKTGTLTLKPFEVSALHKKQSTPAISVYVQGNSLEYRPFFSWRTPLGELSLGEPREAALLLTHWDPQKPLPPPELLRPRVPAQAILEELPLGESDLPQGILLRVRIIPLGGQEFTLEPLQIRHEGIILEVPGLRFPLIPKKPESQEKVLPPAPPEISPWKVSFPEIPRQGFSLFRAEYEKALPRIQQLWEAGQLPEALGELRRNERETWGGPQFAALRREAEQRLGFGLAPDERPRKLFILGFLIGLGILLPLGIWVIRRFRGSPEKTVTSLGPWGYKGIVILLITLMSLTLFCVREGIFTDPQNRKKGLAILREASAYRVPDQGGGVSAHFSPGQPVIIRSLSDSWVYVESFDGRIGWVPRDRVIIY